jgi:hypothetical protein
MDMRQNHKSAFLVLPLLLGLAAGINSAPSKSQTGQLVGSMGYVDVREKESQGDAAGVTVELEYKRRVVKLTSNQQGDYIVALAKGEYCLKSAVTADNKPLSFSPRQPKCFKIKPGKDSRFDVMLLKP